MVVPKAALKEEHHKAKIPIMGNSSNSNNNSNKLHLHMVDNKLLMGDNKLPMVDSKLHMVVNNKLLTVPNKVMRTHMEELELISNSKHIKEVDINNHHTILNKVMVVGTEEEIHTSSSKTNMAVNKDNYRSRVQNNNHITEMLLHQHLMELQDKNHQVKISNKEKYLLEVLVVQMKKHFTIIS